MITEGGSSRVALRLCNIGCVSTPASIGQKWEDCRIAGGLQAGALRRLKKCLEGGVGRISSVQVAQVEKKKNVRLGAVRENLDSVLASGERDSLIRQTSGIIA